MGILKPEILFEATNVFKEKKWYIEEDLKTIRDSIFDRYINRLKEFDYEEQKLFIELTKKYILIQHNTLLHKLFLDPYNLIEKEKLDNASKIIFLPLTDPYLSIKNVKNDSIGKRENSMQKQKRKSGEVFLELFERLPHYDFIHCEKFIFPSNILEVEIDKESLIIFVDDFIGTGETAENCLSKYIDDGLSYEVYNQTIILSFASMNTGKNYLYDNYGISVYSKYILDRAISNIEDKETRNIYSRLMTNMESKIRPLEDCKFGYKHSEALITIWDKTPDNTFPVFWHQTKNKSAPFPRKK